MWNLWLIGSFCTSTKKGNKYEKTDNNIQKMNSENLINGRKLSEDEEVKDNPYNLFLYLSESLLYNFEILN